MNATHWSASVTKLLADLPPIEAFPTVDEMFAFTARLAEEHPDRVTLREVGRSRDGDAIELLSIRPLESRVSVLVVGQPHPNEPIGMATITTMCERLLADQEELDSIGASWHFLPCVDPDGTRLNEGWFAGPWTRSHYARNFYRPGGAAQVEWTFPFSTEGFSVDAPMPETVAMMAAIDEVRPSVSASLHNGELGGAYFYAPDGADELYPQLVALCDAHGIPLHLGGPEAPFIAELAPAIFSVPTAQQMYDMCVAFGADPATIVSGASSLEYALQYGPVSAVVIELPYWRDDRAADLSPNSAGATRRSVVIEAADLEDQTVAKLRALYEQASPLPPSPFGDAVDAFLRSQEAGYSEARRVEAATDPDYEQTATVAEAFSARDNVHMFRLRMAGMLLRAVPEDDPAHAAVEALFTEWCREAEGDGAAKPIPIRDLVAVQGGAILATVQHSLSY